MKGKIMNIYSILIIPFILASMTAIADDEKYVIDESHFSLGFLVEHAGYAKTLGMFKDIKGSFSYNEEENLVKDINIIVKTSSVFTNHEKRDAHLRSPDFLNVDVYPEMLFKSNESDISTRPLKIIGSLTLLGITKPLVLEASINKIAKYPFRIGISKPIVMGVSARASFNRSDFGMNYAVDKNLVGNTIDLIIEFEARKQ